MRLEFRSYQRPFARVLSTSHGNWEVREGIILRLTDENGQIGWGEIAPISWFGSETLEQAKEFCQQLPPEITATDIFSIPDELPACQFGFECAWGIGNRESGIGNGQDDKGNFSFLSSYSLLPTSHSPVTYSYLLPTGKKALESWQAPWNQGYRTFKWKIGVYPIADELKIFQRLTQTLPASTKLRLDANGGLSYEEANLWLWTCDNVKAEELPVEIEFLEQPLSVAQFQGMAELSMCYATAIALDESVATIDQMQAAYRDGWRGIFVIKPCIAGSPSRLRQFCQQHEIDAVFSSVFETAIGRQAALKLAAELSRHNRAVGFGINHWFDEDEEI